MHSASHYKTPRSHIPVAPFLEHPAVAIRIGEVGEAGIVSAREVEPRCQNLRPRPNGRLVPDLTDLNPAFEQAAPRGLKVRDDEIDIE